MNKNTNLVKRNISNADRLAEKENWTQADIESAICISYGNLKLRSSDKCRFIIFNIPAVITCPGRTAMCEHSCYALKAERNYPEVLPARNYNLEFTKSPLFIGFMVKMIHEICKRPNYRKAEKVVFRIHESGDFYSEEYFIKWLAIANNCRDIKNLQFATYTKSFDILDNVFTAGNSIPENMTIRASVWADTPDKDLLVIAKYKLPIYTAYEKGSFPANFAKCRCQDCGSCKMCINKNVSRIACEIH